MLLEQFQPDPVIDTKVRSGGRMSVTVIIPLVATVEVAAFMTVTV